MAMRWVLPSAASADEATAIDSAAAVARRRNIEKLLGLLPRHCERGEAIHSFFPRQDGLLRRSAPRNDENGLWSYQSISVFGQMQYLPDADLDRGRGRNDLRAAAGLAFDGVDGIQTHVDAHPLRNQALDLLARRAFAAQHLDAGTECDHLDGHLVRVVEFKKVVGDADHEVLLVDVAVGELEHDFVLREGLVLERHLLRLRSARQRCRKQRRADDHANGCLEIGHPAIPGLPSTPFKVTWLARAEGSLPDRR